MEKFLSKNIEGNKADLLIDTSLFSKEIIFKAAFLFLEKAYFFFKRGDNNTLMVQCTRKLGIHDDIEVILGDFSDELLNYLLREKVFNENKEVRTQIITSALQNSLREAELPQRNKTFEEIESQGRGNNNQIDFDKDIDEILREIENDPDLKIDEAEIEKILKEIEEESLLEKQKISINMDGLKNAKKQFNK